MEKHPTCSLGEEKGLTKYREGEARGFIGGRER